MPMKSPEVGEPDGQRRLADGDATGPQEGRRSGEAYLEQIAIGTRTDLAAEESPEVELADARCPRKLGEGESIREARLDAFEGAPDPRITRSPNAGREVCIVPQELDGERLGQRLRCKLIA